LLTPTGVRTLSPADPNYQPRYVGNVASRDRAHHNGPAFPWLLGPLVTVHVRVRGTGEKSRAEALDLIRGCLDHLRGDGLGQVCELFDGNSPHAPGGALAAAAAVGELLRCYVEDIAPGETAKSAAAPDLELTIQPPRIPHPA
jgi:glycogen debranching enzyme